MDSRLEIGIIGLGVGEAHLQALSTYPLAHVRSVCDFSDDKLSSAKQISPEIKLCRDAGEILSDPKIDLVVIASYDNFHADQIETALNAGKHVFVEKPLCQTVEEAKRIRRALEANPGRRLASNLILRRSPRFLALKKRLENGDLGTPYYVEADYQYGRLHKITEGWRGDLDYYSVIQGGGVHVIDLVQWLTGARVEEVSAFGNRLCSEGTKFRFPDLVVALLRFSNGMLAKVSANFGCVLPHHHNLWVFGTKSTFANGFEAGYLYESRDPEQKPRQMQEPYPGVHKGELLKSFVTAIAREESCEISEKEIFDSISVCFAIERALESQGKIKVDYF